MIPLKFQILGAPQASAAYAEMAARSANLSRPLGRYGEHQVRKIRRDLDSGASGVQSRSRQLSSSMTYYFFGPNALGVGSNKVYAASQQFGPRGGFFESSRPGGLLAIPIADNLGARNQPRYDSPREVPEGFFYRTNAGKLLYVRKREKGKSKLRGRRGKGLFHAALNTATAGLGAMFDVLFLLVARVKGVAHHYARHEPADQAIWEGYVADWILRGK